MTFLEFRDRALELSSLLPDCSTQVRVEFWRFAETNRDELTYSVWVSIRNSSLTLDATARTPQLCLTALDQMIAEHLRTLPDVDQQADALGELEPSVANSPDELQM